MQSSMHMAAQTPTRPSRGASRKARVSRTPHMLNRFSTKAACAVACALHRAACYDAGPEHRLGKSLDAEDLRTQRDDGGICREDAHEGRGKEPEPRARQAMMPMPIAVQSQANRFAMSRRWAPTACPMRAMEAS